MRASTTRASLPSARRSNNVASNAPDPFVEVAQFGLIGGNALNDRDRYLLHEVIHIRALHTTTTTRGGDVFSLQASFWRRLAHGVFVHVWMMDTRKTFWRIARHP